MKKLSEYDKKSILAEEVFTEIFEQEDEIEKARMLLSFQDRAKELGVKQGFDTMLKAYKKAEQEMNKKRRSRNALSNWTDFTGKYESMKCGSWLAADDGIRTFNKDYDNEVIVCYHPILPIGRLKNLETGEEQIKLAYKRNHRWTEITVPKDIISSASKIVSLSKLGVSVTSENAKLLVKYLSDVENLNDNDIPLQKSTSKLGWIGGDFIPYDTDILFDGDLQFKQLYESIRQQGSYMEWLNHVCKLRKRDRMEIKFFLAASFASVLVGLLGALPFIVDLWGETEGGKTVAMMLAASVWANPADSMYIGDFKTTDVQLEVRSDLLNNLPLMLDDSSKVSARIRDNFEGVVYDLCSGKGKSRSNRDLGIRKENRWKNAILTNGERPLNSYVTQGGAINRKKMLASQAEVSEHERCYHYILDKISMNGQRFDSSVNVEQWGIIEQGYAIMYVQAARDLCASGGFSYKAFMNWADKNALLQTDGKNQTKLKKIERKTVRCVWIKLDESKDADGFERVAQEELPFK